MNETNIMTNTRIPVDCVCEDGKQARVTYILNLQELTVSTVHIKTSLN